MPIPSVFRHGSWGYVRATRSRAEASPGRVEARLHRAAAQMSATAVADPPAAAVAHHGGGAERPRSPDRTALSQARAAAAAMPPVPCEPASGLQHSQECRPAAERGVRKPAQPAPAAKDCSFKSGSQHGSLQYARRRSACVWA